MLTLTEAASRKLGEVLAQQADHGKAYLGLRLMASPGCCSGPQYGLSLAERTEDGDWVGEYGGIKVMVDPESAPLLSGVRIDFVETAEGSGFTIENPAAADPAAGGGCACGGGGCGGD
ncbi:MAG TPA: iron-sulfur cluster assembly accessory protein [Candidatus Eisenbacteria bacterium]